MIASAIKTWTFADDQLIGVSKPKGYYFAHVPPGKRLLWSKAENTSGIEVEREGGQTYYVARSPLDGGGARALF